MEVKTLNDLFRFVSDHNLDTDKMRFMLGGDTYEPRYFGIYYDENTGLWIVYKNKSDGSRFIRYRGYSEEEAVNIIFDKMKEEMNLRKRNTARKNHRDIYSSVKRDMVITYTLVIAIIVFTICYIGIKRLNRPHVYSHGYYLVDDTYYYHYNDDWYYYDNGWLIYGDDVDDLDDYTYYGLTYDFDDSFYDTDYFDEDYDDYIDYYDNYDNNYDDNDSWDDDDDWDSWDSWDSSDTDWDSDW